MKLDEIFLTKEWEQATPDDKTLFLKEYSKITGKSALDTLGKTDLPLQPIGMNELMFLPSAEEMRSAIPNKTLRTASEFLPMDVTEVAGATLLGKGLVAGGKKLVSKLPSVAAHRLSPEADLLLQKAKGTVQDLVDYPQGAFPGYFPRKVKFPTGVEPTNASTKVASTLASAGAMNETEIMAGKALADKILTGKAGNINLDYIDGSNVRAVIKAAEPLIREKAAIQSRKVIPKRSVVERLDTGLADFIPMESVRAVKLTSGEVVKVHEDFVGDHADLVSSLGIKLKDIASTGWVEKTGKYVTPEDILVPKNTTPTTTLYRGDSPPLPSFGKVAKIDKAAFEPEKYRGQWWTKDRSIAERYGPVKSIEVPTADLEKYKVSNTQEAIKHSFQPGEEYLLSQDTIKSMKPTTPGTKYTDEMMKSLADAADVSLKDMRELLPGDILNAEYALSARNLLHESAQRTFTKAQALENATDARSKAIALGEFKDSMLKHQDIQLGVSGITAEAGRLLRQFKIPISGSSSAQQSILKTAIEEGSYFDDATMEALAKKIGAFTEGDLTRFVSKSLKVTTTDKLVELATAMKLTNPVTFLRNAAGNTMAMLTRLSEKGVSPFIDFLRTGAGKSQPKSVYFQEIPAEIYGMTQGVKKGAQNAAKEMLKIFTGEPTTGAKIAEVQPVRQAIGGMVGQFVRIPYNILSATDEFFKAILNEGALHSYAYRQARNEGLSGMDLAKRVTELAKNPTKELTKQATKVAQEFTFQSELGRFSKGLNLTRQHPIGKLIIPFFKTPVNIGKFVAQRLPPFSLLSPRNYSDIVKKGGPEATEAIARTAFGATVASALVTHAMEGKLTGSPPKDQAERDALERTGWRPWSVKVGDVYYSYLGYDPVATMIASSADLAQAYSNRGVEPTEEVAAKLTTSIIKNLSNQPYLQGLSGILDALSDPDKSAGQFITKSIAGFIPTGIAAAARASDPTVRRPVGLTESMKARIPGLSEGTIPKRNAFGEPYVREEPAFSPFGFSTVKKDPINDWMKGMSYTLGYPSKTIHGRRMGPFEYDEVLEKSGREIKLRFHVIMNSPDFNSLPFADKIRKLNNHVAIARAKAESPFIVPTELRALNIDFPMDEAQTELLKKLILSPTYKLSKNDVAKRDLILNILGRTGVPKEENQKKPGDQSSMEGSLGMELAGITPFGTIKIDPKDDFDRDLYKFLSPNMEAPTRVKSMLNQLDESFLRSFQNSAFKIGFTHQEVESIISENLDIINKSAAGATDFEISLRNLVKFLSSKEESQMSKSFDWGKMEAGVYKLARENWENGAKLAAKLLKPKI